MYEIVIIDIAGMPVNKDNKTIGYIELFKIEYFISSSTIQ